MKILFLLAPSEWKNNLGMSHKERLNFRFEKPIDIAVNATWKDLKCKWDRLNEALELNINLQKWPFLESIFRYDWVVFKAIDYKSMSENWKRFFEDNIYILSGMYWLLKPLDYIWNYKLPIETKWLYDFWWDKVANEIKKLQPDFVVNLLPDSYAKLVWIWKSKKLKRIRELYLWENTKIVTPNFLTKKNWDLKKLSHWVKKYRGEFLRIVCENNLTDFKQFWWKIVQNWEFIDVNIII